MICTNRINLVLHLLVEKLCSLLLLGLVVSEIATVLLRYIYDIGFLKLHDFALYSFSVLVVMSLVYTLGANKHVRVDVFREKQSPQIKQLIDIIAIVLFLIPFFSITLYWVWPDIQYAWSIYEGSRETGGLPGLFIIKSSLPLMCALMIIQSLFVVIRRGKYLNLETEAPATINTSEVQP